MNASRSKMIEIGLWCSFSVAIGAVEGCTVADNQNPQPLPQSVSPKVEFAALLDTNVVFNNDGLVRVRDKELGNVCYYTYNGGAISCVNDISLNMVPTDASWTTVSPP